MVQLSSAIPASLGLLLCAGSVQAALLRSDVKPTSLVQKIHGDHRDCRYSRARGWHRHIGQSDRPVSCEREEGQGRRAEPSVPHDCKPRVEGTGTASLAKAAAVANAIRAWRVEVVANYGELHADYDIALRRSQQCSRTVNGLYRCTVSGSPCEVPHEKAQ